MKLYGFSADALRDHGSAGFYITMREAVAAIIRAELAREECQCVAWAQYGVAHPRGHKATGCAFADSGIASPVAQEKP